jgi:hypothetical protein
MIVVARAPSFDELVLIEMMRRCIANGSNHTSTILFYKELAVYFKTHRRRRDPVMLIIDTEPA